MTAPIYFEIKRVGQFWVAAHPELEDLSRFPQDDVSSFTQIRYYLFAAAEEKYPGKYVLDFPLPQLKAEAFAQIDARSDELILAGFTFEGVVFSLSNEAQIRYATMMMLADALPYPLGINSLDDNTCLYLQNAEHTRAFCLAALGHVKGVVDSGTVQKDAVRAMESADDVSQFSDPR